MTLSAEDRVALILGRAVIRAEALQAALEQAQAKLTEIDKEKEVPDGHTRTD